MTTAPPGLRRLCARADAARRTAERLETGDEVLTPLLADLDGLDLVSGRWIEPLLSFSDGSAALERLLEPSPPSPLPPPRSPSPGEGRHLPPASKTSLRDDWDFEGRRALGERVPPPLGGGAAGSGGGQVGGSPANPHPPAPSPISHPAPRRERGRKTEEHEEVERTQAPWSALRARAHSPGFQPGVAGESGPPDVETPRGASPGRRDPIASKDVPRDLSPVRTVLPGSETPHGASLHSGFPSAEKLPTSPPPLPTTGSPLSRGGGEGWREREARGVRASLGHVLQRLETSRDRTLSPAATPERELPAFPDAPPSLGGLRGLAALASQVEEPSAPTPPPPEPAADDLAERLERLLRREAHRHGIEVEP